jgi:hypothetical protein
MTFEVFIRRNGKILGTYDRDEFISARLQGGILDGDEWMEEGGSFWQLVAESAPYKSSNERKRDRIAHEHAMIAMASNDVYNYRMWSFRILERNNHCLPEHIQSLDDHEFGFIEEISIAGFGWFGPERKIRFLHNQPDVRLLSGFTNQWVAAHGMGKTSLGLALESVRDVANGRKLPDSAVRLLHRGGVTKIVISFRFLKGLELATLEVRDLCAQFTGSAAVVDCLNRVIFHSDESLYSDQAQLNQIASGPDFEYIRSKWLSVDDSIQPGIDGLADEHVLRARIASAPAGVALTAKLLLVLRDAETWGKILVLENPTCRLNRISQKQFEKLFVETTRRSSRQVIMLMSL